MKRSPTASHLSLLPSPQAYVADSQYIHSFLSLPLIPSDLSENGLFRALKERDLIAEVTAELLESTLVTSVLLAEQFVAFLHWLSSTPHEDKQYVKRLLAIVRFRETSDSPLITLEKLKFYDNFPIPSIVPLPSNVLPASIAMYLSREELQKQLNFSPLTLKEFLHFYLLKSQQHLFTQENTSSCLLSVISKHSGQLNKTEWTKFKTTLTPIACIPTSQGMRVPNESYVPSAMLSADLPIITLNVPQNLTEDEEDGEEEKQSNLDNPVSAEFLKRLGCRTVNVQSFVQARSSLTNGTSASSQSMKTFIEHLMEERENMSEGDFNALKQSECLRGTTLVPRKDSTRKYAPQDLHFPSVATRLHWSTLPIIDWPDIDSHSREYAFLKDIGVREVPDLGQLIDRIGEEHQKQGKEYSLPLALRFFAENYQQFYSKLWKTAKIKRPFLPSSSPTKNLVLSLPDEVFKGEILRPVPLMDECSLLDQSPLCAMLLPEVVSLFDEHFNIALLGVKERPTLSVAFDILMEKKEEILTGQSAEQIFTYMNQLDGLSRPLIERVAKLAFIPLPGVDGFLKASQVFIRPNATATSPTRLRQINVVLPPSSSEEEETPKRRAGRKRTAKATTSASKKTKTVSSTPLVMTDDTDKSGLIDYVDFGPEGNSFLLGVGVLHHPSASVLAELLIDRQAEYFSRVSADDLKRKLLAYTSCLRQLAIATHTSTELQAPALVKRLKSQAWCLGYQTGDRQRTFRVVPPTEIYLDDDHQCALDLRPLLPPDEPELTKLYEKFGALWLSECVKRTLVHKGENEHSE